MAKANITDHILHFIVGACNPLLIVLSASTPWTAITAPLYVLGFFYGGCMNVISLRKALYHMPDSAVGGSNHTPQPVVNRDLGDEQEDRIVENPNIGVGTKPNTPPPAKVGPAPKPRKEKGLDS